MLSRCHTRTLLESDKTGKTEWSTASRVIGFEGSQNESVWVLCQNVPVLVSAQNLRPAQDAEALAQAVLQGEPRSCRTVSHVETSGKTSRTYEAYLQRTPKSKSPKTSTLSPRQKTTMDHQAFLTA